MSELPKIQSDATSEMMESPCLANFPVPLYGSVMGLTCLSIALTRSGLFPGADLAGILFLFLVSAWFLVLSTVYLLKWMRYPQEVLKEFNHPVRMNFFPAISISLLLLAIGYFSFAPLVSLILWIAGSVLHFVFLLRTLRVWLFRGLPIQSFNPAWFIPVVGTLIVPLVGVYHAPVEISWFFFSIGLIFWVAMLGITMSRIIFHGGLPPKLLPTLFILIAPPAIAFLAYLQLTGNLDAVAQVLYFNALFTAVLVLSFADKFIKLPFFLSHWAYTFPVAAITLASLRYSQETGQGWFHGLAFFFLGLLATICVIVAIRTIRAARSGEFCVAESA